MSELSFLEKASRSLTGPDCTLPVCLPSAVERLTPRTLRDETFLAYVGAVTLDGDSSIHKRIRNQYLITAYRMIAHDLGLDDWTDLQFENIVTLGRFKNFVRFAVRGGYGVVLDIDAPYDEQTDDTAVVYDPADESHAVGLLPLNSDGTLVHVVSSWVPKDLSGVMHIEDVFEHLVHHRDPRWTPFPFHDANVTYFPLLAA